MKPYLLLICILISFCVFDLVSGVCRFDNGGPEARVPGSFTSLKNIVMHIPQWILCLVCNIVVLLLQVFFCLFVCFLNVQQRFGDCTSVDSPEMSKK